MRVACRDGFGGARIGGHGPSDDAFDEGVVGGVPGHHGVDQLAVAQDRGAVGDLAHLVDIMADEDDGGAFGGGCADQAEELFDTGAGQERGGFVKDEDAGFAGMGAQILDRADDGEERLFDGRKAHHLGPRIEREVVAGEDLRGARVFGMPVDPPVGAGREVADAEVFGDGKRRDEAKVLMHEGEAESAYLWTGNGKGGEAAVEAHLGTGFWGVEARQNLDEGGFARAV